MRHEDGPSCSGASGPPLSIARTAASEAANSWSELVLSATLNGVPMAVCGTGRMAERSTYTSITTSPPPPSPPDLRSTSAVPRSAAAAGALRVRPARPTIAASCPRLPPDGCPRAQLAADAFTIVVGLTRLTLACVVPTAGSLPAVAHAIEGAGMGVVEVSVRVGARRGR
jgi:hypothetical protein